jgi:hypothetical protein
MPPRHLPLASAFLLGVFTFLLYAFRCGSVTFLQQLTNDGALNWGASLILGPWLPASGRLAVALAILVTLTVLALSRSLRHSPPALLALHSISWMLAIITLAIILFARDFALIPPAPRSLTVVTPEMQQQHQRPAVNIFEASWFWIIVGLSVLALFACLKSPTRKSPACPPLSH